MALATTIARYLLGAFFALFGLNGFLHFIPIPPKPELATQFLYVLVRSHYMVPVFIVQILGGVLLLSRCLVPLGLALLAPVLVNILIFHLTMDPTGVVPGAVATLLWIAVAWRTRAAFAVVFENGLARTAGPQRSETEPSKPFA